MKRRIRGAGWAPRLVSSRLGSRSLPSSTPAIVSLLLCFVASCAGGRSTSEEAFRVISRNTSTKEVAILILGRSEVDGPVDWRPLDTRNLTPAGSPHRAVLRFQIPIAETSEVRARIEKKHRGYDIRWIVPATVTARAVVIDEESGRAIKQLKRNRPGQDSFVFNDSGFDFNFVLDDEDLKVAGNSADRNRRKIFDRLDPSKGDVGITIEVTVVADLAKLGLASRGNTDAEVTETLEFRLDALLD